MILNGFMANPSSQILPGSTVIIRNPSSIYNGYIGFVQRISDGMVAVLFEGGNWDKLITIPIKHLDLLS